MPNLTRSARKTFSRASARMIGAFALVSILGACGQSVGDLGRAPSNTVTNTLAPNAGATLAAWRGAPVSDFRLTDDERELRRRSYRLVMPTYFPGWLKLNEAEAVRTRIWPDYKRGLDLADYADDLHYRYSGSQAARYGKIADDARADAALIEPFFGVAYAVYEADQYRLTALKQAHFNPSGEAEHADSRLYENRRVINWAVDSVRWRVMSYAYALERARIEVPTHNTQEALAAVAELDRQSRILERSISDMRRGGATRYAGPVSKSGTGYGATIIK